MKVQEFINQYKVYGDDFIVKHIVTKYVPWTAKVAEAQEIINKTTYKEVNGNKIFWANTPLQFFWFMCRLIHLYTDIEMDYEGKIADDYDALNELGLINKIVAAIPETEYAEFKTVLSMCTDDEFTNVRSIPSYLDTKLEALSMLTNSLVNSEAVQEIVKEAINNDNIVKFPNQEG